MTGSIASSLIFKFSYNSHTVRQQMEMLPEDTRVGKFYCSLRSNKVLCDVLIVSFVILAQFLEMYSHDPRTENRFLEFLIVYTGRIFYPIVSAVLLHMMIFIVVGIL